VEPLESYLHTHIPLSAAMGVRVIDVNRRRVVLRAPLGPNINHQSTLFGGSAAAIATLAAWSWLWVRTAELPSRPRLVVRSSAIEYLAPVEGDFEAICEGTEDEEYARFLIGLERKGKARIDLRARLEWNGIVAADLRGVFVALREA